MEVTPLTRWSSLSWMSQPRGFPVTLYLWCVALIIIVITSPPATATSTFKLPLDSNAILPHACPGEYNEKEPWHRDEEDCACYYVCDHSGGAVRMCCHEGLWWHQESKTCLYMQDFSRHHFDMCIGLVRGNVALSHTLV